MKKGTRSLSPAYDITYANGTGYTKNHQLSLRGKTACAGNIRTASRS